MGKIVPLILFCSLIMASTLVYAHPPSEINIEHSSELRMISIVVAHPVSNSGKHFINKIIIWLNGKEILQHKIGAQDDNRYQSAAYMIPDAKAGDVIAVEAYCNISGKLKKEIKVE